MKVILFLTTLLLIEANAYVIRDFPSALSDFSGGAHYFDEFFNNRIREKLFFDFSINSGIDNVYAYSAGLNYKSEKFLVRTGYSYLPIEDLELRTGEVKVEPDGYFDVVYFRPVIGVVGAINNFIYLAEADVVRYKVIDYSINKESLSLMGGKRVSFFEDFYSAKIIAGTKNSQRGDMFNFSVLFSNRIFVTPALDIDLNYWYFNDPLETVNNVELAFTINKMFSFRTEKDFGNSLNIVNFGTGVDVFGINLFYNIKLFDHGFGALHSGGLRIPL